MEVQKALVIYWHSKGHSASIIHAKLKAYDSQLVPGYSTITDWCRKIKQGHDILERHFSPGRPMDIFVGPKIISFLNEFPFSSIRSISQELKIPRSTVHCHLLNGDLFANICVGFPTRSLPRKKVPEFRWHLKF